MSVPEYLTDQNEAYIKKRGFTFRDFSPEQIIEELRMSDIRTALSGKQRGFTTIADGVGTIGHKTRWATLRNPISNGLYRCVRRKKKTLKLSGIDTRHTKLKRSPYKVVKYFNRLKLKEK